MPESTTAEAVAPADPAVEGATGTVLETGHLLGLVLEKVQAWVEGAVQMLPNLLVALLLVMVFAAASRLVDGLVRRTGRRANSAQPSGVRYSAGFSGFSFSMKMS